jgi:hypothetical protein
MRLAALILLLALPAYAQSTWTPDVPRQQFAKTATGFFAETRAGLFFAGLGLVGAGLILGGAGFALLYTCNEGADCDTQGHTRTVGWILAAPGLIPLAVGAILVWVSTGGRTGMRVDNEAPAPTLPFALGLAPVRGGAVSSATFAF